MMMQRGLEEISRLLAFGFSGTTFDAVAIGTGSTAPAIGQLQLVSESTTNGGSRKSGSDVTASLTGSNNNTLRFLTTFIFTGTLGLFELMVGNNASANTGVMLLRQTFAAVLNVVAQDNLQLQIDIVGSDEAAATDSIITNVGISETNKQIATDLSTAAKLTALAVGSGSTALAATQTALVTEILAAGAKGLGRGEGVHTVTLDTVNTANDTVKISTVWNVIGTQAVREVGMFDTVTPSSGNMYIRVLYAADLNLVNTDVFTQAVRYVNK